MKVRVAIVAAALTTICFGAANAAQVYGVGAQSCASFTAAIQADPSVENSYFDWTQGYISGQNIELEAAGGRPAPSLLPQGFGASEQKAFIRSFCATNPNEDFASAGDQIFFQIRKMYSLTS